MKIFRNTILAASLALVAGAAVASDKVLLTSEASKSGRNFVSLDLTSDGNTGAFSFVVDLPADASNVDVKGCLAELPKSHQGECRVVKGNRLAVIAFSMQNASLEPGVVSLGSISFDSKAKAELAASQVALADAKGGKQDRPVAEAVTPVE
jgi:hypothetical protein